MKRSAPEPIVCPHLVEVVGDTTTTQGAINRLIAAGATDIEFLAHGFYSATLATDVADRLTQEGTLRCQRKVLSQFMAFASLTAPPDRILYLSPRRRIVVQQQEDSMKNPSESPTVLRLEVESKDEPVQWVMLKEVTFDLWALWRLLGGD